MRLTDAENSRHRKERDPLIYNFIKSVNEKHRQETWFCQCHQEEQSAWLKE